MRRGAKPTKSKVKGKPPAARKSLKNEASGGRELEKRLAESLVREKATGEILQEKDRALAEALEQQTATAEILRVISRSRTDVQPVFDTIAERAVKLCDAEVGVVSIINGEYLQLVAMHGLAAERAEAPRRAFPMSLDAESTSARAVRSRAVAHFADAIADPHYQYRDTAQVGRWRATLAVPMIRGVQVIGAIFVARATPGVFRDSQIALMETFASQAVIAIENVRLFTELQGKNRALTEAHRLAHGLDNPRHGVVFWQLAHWDDGRDLMAPGSLNTLPIASAISAVRQPVCRRSSVSLVRHAEQRNLPRYLPRRRSPTSRRTKSSVL